FKTGFSWQQNNDNQTNAVYNQYTFPNVASYLAAKNDTTGCTVSGITNPGLCYSSFSTTQGNPGAAYKSNFYDFFVQDSWQLRPNLLLIYGVRYDYYASPAALANAPFIYNRSFNNPGADFAPRLGLAYSITPKTVLRVSSGKFYDVPSTNLWYETYANGGLATAFQGTFTPTTTGAPLFPSNPTTGASLGTPTIYALTPNYKTPYTINSSIQITRELSKNDALTVGYVNTEARQLTYMRDVNLINPTSFLADGRPVYSGSVNASTRLFPQFNGIRLMDSGANANYNALIVNLNHRFSTGFSVNASYTYSHSLSDAPELWGYDQSIPIEDPSNRNRDYGNSIINRPNAFTMSAVFMPTYKLDNRFLNRLANGNQLTLLATLQNGDEESITTSTLLNNDPIGTSERPLGIGRDTVSTPNVYQIDSRLTRTLFTIRERLNVKFIAEGLNIFNTRNYTTTNTTAGTNALGVITSQPTYAPTASVLEGRLLQIGIRADW
ncbi:MAG: TonB-dependent receptor, partial [Bryobacteraceae bacterium]